MTDQEMGLSTQDSAEGAHAVESPDGEDASTHELTPREIVSELDKYIRKTKFAVFPHQDNSMIVSGAFYHAITHGANIVCLPSRFASAMTRKHRFVTILETTDAEYLGFFFI